MNGLDPHVATLAALTAAIGYTMVAAGVTKKQLRWRAKPRCRSCGNPRTACRCRLSL